MEVINGAHSRRLICAAKLEFTQPSIISGATSVEGNLEPPNSMSEP